MERRRFLTLTAGVVAGAALLPAVPAHAARPLRVLVVTNEPWGTYHIKSILDEAAAARPAPRWEVALVVPDRSGVTPTDPVPVVTLAEAAHWGADLLVVNGATAWPTQVVQTLTGLPVVASSFAYLTPVEAAGAASIRPRIVAMTAASTSEAAVFAAHFGLPASRVRVIGNINLDDLPPYRPTPRTALIATSVTYPSSTGGAAPGTQVLLDSAAALAAAGWHIRVGLHPRENPALWSQYERATEGTLMASTTAEVTVGIPGSVFPQIAAVGCPLVGIVVPGLTVPPYILALCAQAGSVPEVLTAVEARALPTPEVMTSSVGPVGGSGDRLWKIWRQSAAPYGQRRSA